MPFPQISAGFGQSAGQSQLFSSAWQTPSPHTGGGAQSTAHVSLPSAPDVHSPSPQHDARIGESTHSPQRESPQPTGSVPAPSP